MKPPFSKEEVVEDFTKSARYLRSALDNIYMPGTSIESTQTRPFDDGLPSYHLSNDNFELHQKTREDVEDAFDFAYFGVIPNRSSELNADSNRLFQAIEEILDPFITFYPAHFVFHLSEPPENFNQAARSVLDTALARIHFECGLVGLPERISIGELAILSGLDEKTIRNLASSKQKNRIKTVKINNRTYINNEDAMPWLMERGYIPIRTRDDASILAKLSAGFSDLSDLRRFISDCSTTREVDAITLAKKVAKKTKTKSLAPTDIDASISGKAPFKEDIFSAVAETLDIPKSTFVVAVLSVFQRLEMNDLKERMNNAS